MNGEYEPSAEELLKIVATGLLRSVEMLEAFVVQHVDPVNLSTSDEQDFLNRIKERMNSRANPIAVYLRPNDIEN